MVSNVLAGGANPFDGSSVAILEKGNPKCYFLENVSMDSRAQIGINCVVLEG